MHIRSLSAPMPVKADINDFLDAVIAILNIIERVEELFGFDLTGWIAQKDPT
jgi:hypothetical protein